MTVRAIHQAASGMPMHRQIGRILESRIVNGLYLAGTMIPSELRLCEEFGVSRITVRHALAELVSRGLLSRYPGRGTLVSDHLRPAATPASTGYIDDLLLLFAATEPVGRHRAIISASPEVAGELQVAEGAPVALIAQWRTLGGDPFSVSSTYLAPELAAQIADDDLARSTFIELLEQRLGAKLSGAHQVLWATTADLDVADRIGVPFGAPVLGMRLTFYSADESPVAYGVISLRGDRYAHHIRLGRVPVNSTYSTLRLRGSDF